MPRKSTIDLSKVPTPCYVCEEALLDYNLDILDYVQQKSGAKIMLALKGFALWKAFGRLKNVVHGACASGLYEARLAREEINREVHCFSPGFTETELDDILKYADHIVFNSFSQLERFYDQCKSKEGVSIGMRVNPEYSEVDVEKYDPCAPGSRFGVTVDSFEQHDWKKLDGIHFHTHCEQNSDALERGLHAFEEKFGTYIPHMKWINFGGGHWITHDDYDVERLIRIIQSFKARYNNIEVYLEPGEAFGWQTGPLVTSVVDIIEKPKQSIAIIDCSIDAHMPDCLIMPYDPEIRDAGDKGEYPHEYTFGGNTCMQGDRLEKVYSFKEPLQIGDKIVFEDMIHYTIVKNTLFNGVKLPSIALWTKDQELKMLNRYGYEEYKNRNS